jgi:hypothetical protein
MSGYKQVERSQARVSCFCRRPGRRIHHVAIHASNVPPLNQRQGRVPVGPVAFESGGGGSKTTSPQAALRRSSGVRLTASDFHAQGVQRVAKDPFVLISESS